MKNTFSIVFIVLCVVSVSAYGAPPDIVYIPGGTFQMGDSFNEGRWYERPVHTVKLDSFYMGKYEVTNEQYCEYLNFAIGSSVYVSGGVVYGVGNNQPYCDTSTSNSYSQISYTGSVFSVCTKNGRSMVNDPMNCVSWYGSVAYCNWRSQREGYEECYDLSTWNCDFSKKGYRLPTEAEWEYAARGGLSDKRFPWGDTISHSQANYYSDASFSYDISPTRGYHPVWNDGVYPYTSPVGSFTANGYGLYDMAGDITEWCNDWFQYAYYTGRPNPDINPTGPSSGSARSVRGNSWDHTAYYCRVAFRADTATDNRNNALGFRVVLKNGPDMVPIPGGTFQMGDSIGDGWPDQRPVHTVTLSSFYMDKYNLTNDEYCEYLNSALGQGLITVMSGVVYKADSGTSYPYCETSTSNSCSLIDYSDGVFSVRTKGGRDMSNDPIVLVSWYGAAAYCNWLSQRKGKEQCYDLTTWNCDFSKNGYRLATEAEWEYAARGGLVGKRFPWGDTISHIQANYWSDGSYSYDVSTTRGDHPIWGDGIYPHTSPVGSFSANVYGLYDMAGNVWEWCNDWYSVYSSTQQTNPTGPTSGLYRVNRGGSWASTAAASSVANRTNSTPALCDYRIGFRIVCNAPPTANAGENIQIMSSEQATTIISATATDADGDPLLYRWIEGSTILTDWESVPPEGQFYLNLGSIPLFSIGVHTLTLEVTDGQCSVSDNMILTIQNSPPEVQPAPSYQVVEIGVDPIIIVADVADFDGDTVTYQWLKGSEVLSSGSVQTVLGGERVMIPDLQIPAGDPRFTLGVHQIDLKVDDSVNEPVSALVSVEVADTMSPSISPVPSVTILWPPNHELQPVTIAADAFDNGGGAIHLEVSVQSSEPPDTAGDGSTIPDYYIDSVDDATGIIQLRLRSERAGTGDGRTYTITITATDASGNNSVAIVEIRAPHDRRKK